MFLAEDSVYSCLLSLHLKQGKEKWPWIHLLMLMMQMTWEVINSVLTLGHSTCTCTYAVI